MAGTKGKKPRAKRRPYGRKHGITPERVKVLVKACGAGVPRGHAAALAKISIKSFSNWLTWGEEAWNASDEGRLPIPEDRKLHVQLFLELKLELADTMQTALTNIGKAGKKHWQASAWLLTRLAPDKFADNRREMADMRKELKGIIAELDAYRKAFPGFTPPKSGEATVPDLPPEPEPPMSAFDPPSVNVLTPSVEKPPTNNG